MNTFQQNDKLLASRDQYGKQDNDQLFPKFLLSLVLSCVVELVPDATQQTYPSRTKVELLADGQCEV